MSRKGWTKMWLTLVLVGSVVRADEMSLSHLVTQANSDGGLVGIDYNAMARFCADSDGCEIVVRLEKSTEGRTTSARLFMNAGIANRWFSSATGGVYRIDTAGGPEQVIALTAGSSTCIMDDGDPFDPGLDNALGFELAVFGGGADVGTCTVTISD